MAQYILQESLAQDLTEILQRFSDESVLYFILELVTTYTLKSIFHLIV